MQVTAFTLAHSFSLALATLGWVRISGRIVEPLIAASIVWVALAAWQSMRARRSRPRAAWHQALVAFLFGLVHGLAFAEALTPLHLDGAALAWALLAFNLGVEIGQLLVLVVTVPALLALRRTSAGSQALPWFALGAAAAGGFWLVQRLLGE